MTLQLTKQMLFIGEREIVFEQPANQDQLLEDAIRCESSGSSDCDPYWGTLWETAPEMATLILRHEWPTRLRTLELGCGIGVTGIAALIAGHDVTFSDHSSAAVKLAMSNAALNGFPDSGRLVFDWRQPPTDTFDFIVGSDILYDEANHEPLLRTFHTMLNDNGVVWIGDPGRTNALRFTELAVARDWSLDSSDEFAHPFRQPAHANFRLLTFRRAKARIPAYSATVENRCYAELTSVDSTQCRLPQA